MRVDWIMACKLPSVAGTCRVRADAGKLRSARRSANSETWKSPANANGLSIQKYLATTEQREEKSIGLLMKRNRAGRILLLRSTERVEKQKPQIPVINAHARGCQLAKRCIPSPVVV
jgi:hypothetical protein